MLEINRSSLYCEPKPLEIDDVELLNMIRDIWNKIPFYGYRRITKELRCNYHVVVNRKRVQRLMQLGGIYAIHPGPNTSKRNKAHAVYPYLLKDLEIMRPNQVFQVDITYLRMSHGFMYLVALIDVYSRYIVSWALSNTLDTAFCIEALELALARATPEIINSDQGSQFTSDTWVEALKDNQIKISMTGKGRCIDNIYIERFWRSFKREEFYLNEYGNVTELREAIKSYIKFYNEDRWHQALDYQTPASVYKQAKQPMEIWTSPADQPAPFGAHGQAMDNANALPTT